MKIKKKISEDYEINIIEFVKTLWEKKFYVLIITLSFTVAFYTYSANENKLYQTKIITSINQLNFKNNLFFLEKAALKDYGKIFTISFNQKLLSFDNLIKFAKQYDQLDEFTSYLKTKNITIENYFDGKLRKIYEKKNKISDTYVLDFTKPLPGQKFLNDYFSFTKMIAETEVREMLLNDLQNLVLIYKQQMKIAKEIDLVNPMPQVIPKIYNNLYYKGIKTLNVELQIIEESINQIENISLNYNVILDQASKPIQISKSNLFFVFFGFATGLFLSIFGFFFTNILRERN